MIVKKIAQLTGHNGAIFSFCEGEAKHYIISAAGDGWVVQWDLNQPEVGRLIAKAEANIFSSCLIREKMLLLLGDMNGGVHWIKTNDATSQRNVAHHQKGTFDIKYIDNHIYTIGGDGVITKWDVEKQRSLESIKLSNQSLRTMTYAKQRNELAVGTSDRGVYIIDIESFTLKTVINDAHSNSIFSIAYSPDERYLLTGGRDAQLKVWYCNEGFSNIQHIAAHLYTINAICYHPQGHIFATASRDKTIKLWDSNTFELLKVIDTIRLGCHINSVNTLFWADFNYWLISGGDDRSIMIWEIA